jgi:hypothetical protein
MSSDVHITYSKQIEKNTFFWKYKAGQTCRIKRSHTDKCWFAVLCRFWPHCSLSIISAASRQKSQPTLSSCHKHLLSLKLPVLDSSYCRDAHICHAAAAGSCKVCVCVCMWSSHCAEQTRVKCNVHRSNLNGCHTMATLLMIQDMRLGMLATDGCSSYVGQAYVHCPTVWTREVPYRHFKIKLVYGIHWRLRAHTVWDHGSGLAARPENKHARLHKLQGNAWYMARRLWTPSYSGCRKIRGKAR